MSHRNFCSISLFLPLLFLSTTSPLYAAPTVEHASSSNCDAGPVTAFADEDWRGVMNPTSDTIGGGPDYSAIESDTGANVTEVASESALRNALATPASTPRIIYLDPAGNFELTGTLPIWVPSGITIASNRGKQLLAGGYSEGARIHVSEGVMSANTAVFDVGANVRITGLRLEGPYSPVDEDNPQIIVNGIIARSISTNFVVDNSELSGWSGAAVYLQATKQAHIHHNHIHNNHNQFFYQNGDTALGYGVGLYGDADALVEANVFDYNRHSIAGDGHAGQSYEARYNIVQQHLSSHAFDMHGYDPVPPDNTADYVAGNEIYIHHNTFLATQANSGTHSIPASTVAIRGKPTTCAWIRFNALADAASTSNTAKALIQQNQTEHYVESSNDFEVVGLLASNGANGEWMPVQAISEALNSIHIGDFDGDGKSDLFRADGADWEFSSGGNTAWQSLSGENILFSNLRFGDFDGDGRTDVFYRKDSGRWAIRSSVLDYAEDELQISTYALSELRFGDFDYSGSGIGKMDVFHRANDKWEISSGADNPWSTLRTFSPSNTNPPLAELAFGDFNGDGKTDVLHASGSQWTFYYSGGSVSSPVSSTFTVANLLVGNFDNDAANPNNTDDIMVFDAGLIKVFDVATTTWTSVNKIESDMSTATSAVGDFNGDGKAELLWKGIPKKDYECDDGNCPFVAP